jgi:F-type H+-transporting ATPase subunit delta
MLTKGIADRYARALLALASTTEELDLFDSQLEQIVELDEKDESLVRFLTHPKVEKLKKKDLVSKVLGPYLSRYVLSMVLLVIDKNRGHLLVDVAKRFNQIADEVRGVEKGTVISAIQLPDDLFQRLERKIQRFSDRNIILQQELDPAIIGGVIVKLGNHIFDGSVRAKLGHFRDEMKKVNVVSG